MAAPAVAGEVEVGVFGGANWAAHNYSTLSNGTASQQFVLGWQGNSFQAPIYYGVQAIYWSDQLVDWGVGIDYTHAKAYGDFTDPNVIANFTVLEFTDGLNQLTANAFHKWDFDNGLRGYVGAGIGLGIPHVEVTTTAASVVGATTTFEYQLTGAVFQLQAGVSYEFLPDWRVFGGYKVAYQTNNAQLTGGGTFSNNFVTQQILAGVSYSFDAGDY